MYVKLHYGNDLDYSFYKYKTSLYKPLAHGTLHCHIVVLIYMNKALCGCIQELGSKSPVG